MRGETAIARVGGELRLITEIFVPGKAVEAMATAMAEPGNAHAPAELMSAHLRAYSIDPADDLLAGNDRQFGIGQLPITT